MSSAMFVRRQFAPTSTSAKRALSALASAVLNKPISCFSAAAAAAPLLKFVNTSDYVRNDALTAARLDFRAPFASHAAGYAVADYYNEEKSRIGGGGGDEGLEISKLNIHKDIVNCLALKGITKLFPIQRAVLEPAMQGRDMIGRAKTGTGKTLAFGIPILDNITRYNEKHGLGRDPLALVLAPTRELAKQVEKEFSESSKLETLCVYGGSPIGRQMSILNQGVDIVVGTPGRVIDLLNRGALVLSQVQFMVLDEADQMLNVGFAEDVEKILEKLPPKRQTMMFSATMPSWILKLTRQHLKDPVTIDLVGDSDQKLAEGISLHTVVVDHHSKAGVIGPLVTEYANGGKCIVFTQTKRDADSLAHAMGNKNYRCEALHGDIAQGQRERTLKAFRDGSINVLIATDVAARGLDIPNVDLVIHFELPTTSEIFVHRSGRTGRAGKKGIAILIHTMDQSRAVRVIERDVGGRFKELPPVTPDGAEMNMSGGFRSGGRFGGGHFGGGGRSGNSSFSRGGGYGNSDFGRDGGWDDFGRSSRYGVSSSRSSGYGESGSRYGSPRSSGGGYSQGSSGFGRPDNGFGDFGNFGSGRQSGFGEFGFGQMGSGSSRSSRFGSFGDN